VFASFQGRRRTRRLLIAALTAGAIAVPSAVTATASAATTAGDVNFMRTAEGTFDTFTANPTAAQKTWMHDHYWRMRAYAPYFDSRLSWSSKTWLYQSAYAIYPGSTVATQHPDWILHDAAGNKLYIPFGCHSGVCTQYAGDVGNPAFRQWWIDQARSRLAKGYTGIYIDDVNLYRKVSNGSGVAVDPIDPRTGGVLTEPTWQHYLADHLAGVRAAFPTAEIIDNVIWFAGDTTADQQRVLRSANLINLERGVNDSGITGGTGKWSYQKLLAFIDHRQAEGHGVVFDATATTDSARLYALASYFLISSGRDGIGNDKGGTPSDWWKGYDTDLGAPLGARYAWKGVLRRDFQRGFTVVNAPAASSKTLPLGAGARDLTGAVKTTVTLGAASGAVFVTAAPPVPAATATFTVPATETAAAVTSTTTTTVAGAVASTSAPTASSAATAARTFILKVSVLKARHVKISGRLRGARGGRMVIVVRKRSSRHAVRRVAQRTTNGRFVRVLPRMRPGKYKVAVTYRARTAGAATVAAARAFSVPS
jgi:Hypothetical glycosyl hydrolase family 15